MCQSHLLRLWAEFTRFTPYKRVPIISSIHHDFSVGWTYLKCDARERWIPWQTVSIVAPGLRQIGSDKSGWSPLFFVYTLDISHARLRSRTYLTSPSSYMISWVLKRSKIELTRQILSNNQSIPRSSSQLSMTVLPSPSLAKASKVSIDTPSILLIAVKAGMYFLVPSRTSMNSSSVIWSQQSHLGVTHIFSDHDVAIVYCPSASFPVSRQCKLTSICL